MTTRYFFVLAKTGHILGKGLIAGLIGTAAITVSQMIEMKLSGRGESKATVKVGGDVLGVEPKGKAEEEKIKAGESTGDIKDIREQVKGNEKKFGWLMHFGYGTAWGIARGAFEAMGLYGPIATAIHFGAVWGAALIMLPSTGAAEPVSKWTPGQIATDAFHHMVYALAAGGIYDEMIKAERTTGRGIKRYLMGLLNRL